MKKTSARLQTKSQALLDSCGKEDIEKNRKKEKNESIKKIKTTFLITVALLLSFSICFAVFGIAGEGIKDRFFEGVDNLAMFLADKDFFDLSGRKNYLGEYETSKTEPVSSSTQKPEESKKEESIGSGNKSIYDFDYSKVPSGEIPIIPMDLSLIEFGNEYINNMTGYSPDLSALLEKDVFCDDGPMEIAERQSDPLVLIVHTHATEAYREEDKISFPAEEGVARSHDKNENVVGIGKIFADILNKSGIPTLHSEILHDELQYKDSYVRSGETIKKYLEEYPSIKLVIDLHRDSIIKSNGEYVRPLTEVDGEACAQVMCVVGSDWGGSDCPNWQSNLALSLKLRERLNDKYGNLCRPTYLKTSTYNQELTRFSLLIEIGASGNSFSEAERAAELVAKELSYLLKDLK